MSANSFQVVRSRTRIVLWCTVAIMAVFIGRLFYLQIIKHGVYVALADQEQLKRLAIPAKRGLIYAMDGSNPVPLALNQAVYTVFADPSEVTDATKIIETIQRVAGGNARDNLSGLLAAKNRYQVLATNVTRKQAELIKAQSLQGVGFQETSQRVYPEGALAAQTLGFVDASGQGRYGVEQKLNNDLKGKDGLLQSVTDVSNVPLTIGKGNINTPAQDGKNVVLTIDRNVQAYAEKALAAGLKKVGAPDGSVIVMDPQTGKVLAMANLPTYNPGKYYDVKDIAAFDNAVVSAPYEPGSVMKTYTCAIGIDTGTISPYSTFNNTDYVNIDGFVISNAAKGHTGIISFQTALDWSLNTGMVAIAERLGDGQNITLKARNTMYNYLHDKFRLGELTGIQVANEQQGIVIPPTSPEGNAVRYSNMSFGQGMDLTMLQVATGFSAIVNGGTYHTPTLVEGTLDDSGTLHEAAPLKSEQIISPSTSSQVEKMAHDARAAFYTSLDKPGYYIGGKTGTSQDIVNGKYTFNETTGTYIGYGGSASDKKPRYVIMVQVSGKGMYIGGNTHAMPIFNDISNWMLDYLKIAPKG